MTIEGTAPAGQPDVSVTQPEAITKEQSSVSFEAHRKLLDEKKKTQAKLDELLGREKEREEADARKRGDYEAILKARDEELVKERERRVNLETTLTTGQKLNAVIDALGGSVDPRWYRLIDVSAVATNPDTGEVDGLTVAKVAESLKREWPEMIKAGGNLPKGAPQGVNGGPGKITESEWKGLKSSKEQMKYTPSDIVWGS
jgi:hypothetical protein